MLYELIFYDKIEDYRQGFFIGVFSSYEKAEAVAKRYLKEVIGFKDYRCEYEIVPKKRIGELDGSNHVYMLWGWNLNEDFDEVDIWESDIYTNRDKAESELRIVKHKYEREEWCLSKYIVDKTYCEEGFIRSL